MLLFKQYSNIRREGVDLVIEIATARCERVTEALAVMSGIRWLHSVEIKNYVCSNLPSSPEFYVQIRLPDPRIHSFSRNRAA